MNVTHISGDLGMLLWASLHADTQIKNIISFSVSLISKVKFLIVSSLPESTEVVGVIDWSDHLVHISLFNGVASDPDHRQQEGSENKEAQHVSALPVLVDAVGI